MKCRLDSEELFGFLLLYGGNGNAGPAGDHIVDVILCDLDGEEGVLERTKLVRDELILIGGGTLPVLDGLFPRRFAAILLLVAELGTGTGLVENVDRLVRQKAVGDVAVRLLDGGGQGVLRVTKLMKRLVPLDDALDDLDRLGLGRRFDLDGLKAALKRTVLLDRLAKFAGRGRSDALNVAA